MNTQTTHATFLRRLQKLARPLEHLGRRPAAPSKTFAAHRVASDFLPECDVFLRVERRSPGQRLVARRPLGRAPSSSAGAGGPPAAAFGWATPRAGVDTSFR